MSANGTRVWDWLRQSRATPPSSIADDVEQLEIFRSCMRQFEDLIGAARSTGAAGKPLPLFYAASQAASAIIAVHGGEQPTSHGLSFIEKDSESALGSRVAVRLGGRFSGLANALGEPEPKGEIALGALLNSLPEFSDRRHPTIPGWDSALYVEPEFDQFDHRMVRVIGIVIDPFPTEEEANSLLVRYPSLQRVTWEVRHPNLQTLRRMPTRLGDGLAVGLRSEKVSFDAIAPEYRFLGNRWLRPVCGCVELHPLLTWWALLFGLSNLARYYPVQWTQAIDLDQSDAAVVLDRVMTEALEALPQLVLGAIAGEAFVLDTD